MPYIGRSTDGFGLRNRYFYTASGSETSVSGNDDNGNSLSYADGQYVDVYKNGTKLQKDSAYNTNTNNTIGGLSALSASDVIEVVVYDIFVVPDAVSAASGGTFDAAITVAGNISASSSGNISATGGVITDEEGQINEDRAIMLEGTDSDYSNEGSLLLLDATAASTNVGEKLLFEKETMAVLPNPNPEDYLRLENNDSNGYIYVNASTNERDSGATRIVLEDATEVQGNNDQTLYGLTQIANVGGGSNTNYDNSVSVDINAQAVSGGTFYLDLDLHANYELTLAGNCTIANPSSMTAGTTGSLFIVQDGTGSRTVAWGSQWDFAAGTAPTMTTTASAVDRVDYIVRNASKIHADATLAYS